MDATDNQKRALYNMYAALKWDEDSIHKMTFEEASEEISKTKKHITEYGFPSKDTGSDGFGNDAGW